MNKKHLGWLVVLLLLVTNVFTGAISHYATLMGAQGKTAFSGEKAVSISESDYAEYLSFKKKASQDGKGDGQILISKEEFERMRAHEKTNEKVSELETFILENYYKDFDKDKFTDGILKGLFMALNDPYSIYMNKDEFSKFTEETEGVYGGIGIIVTPTEDGMVTVVAPIEDTPGERAGIQSGDKILKVEDMDITAEVMDEAVRKMRGNAGEKVQITIYRKSVQKTIPIDIVREEIRLKTVKSRKLDEFAYLRISMFDNMTSDDFKTHLDERLKENPKGLIIDLRNNPGGSLSEVVKIADRLLGKQMIVYTKNRLGEKREYKSGFLKVDLPMAILTNGGSASASEILAGAVQDTKSGVIVGEKTFGKGVVQTVISLEDGSGFKLTTSQYFTPNGRNIHGIGIEPDVKEPLSETYREIKDPKDSDDNQLQKAIEVLRSQIKGE